MPTSEPYQMPRGAKSQLERARRSYRLVRLHGVRGASIPSPEYSEARKSLVGALAALSELHVPQRVVAAELGITRSAVSQWLNG